MERSTNALAEMTMPTERKCEAYICLLDDYFAKRVFGLAAAKAFCQKHKGERPNFVFEGIYDEDFRKDWETYK